MAPQRDAGKAPGSAPGLHIGHGLGDEAPAHAGAHHPAPEPEIAGHHQHDAGEVHMALEPPGKGDLGAPLAEGGHDQAQQLGIGHGAGDVAGEVSLANWGDGSLALAFFFPPRPLSGGIPTTGKSAILATPIASCPVPIAASTSLCGGAIEWTHKCVAKRGSKHDSMLPFGSLNHAQTKGSMAKQHVRCWRMSGPTAGTTKSTRLTRSGHQAAFP